ncbi:MAG TPA: phage tail protein [Bacillus bacterium]|nr:phage tail protein [Bacillus sp. (in: firmicutes)]
MGESYVGEIRMFGGNYAPRGWALCDGSVLNIAENEILFSLIGTTYGGDGVNTFKLPDLRGRIPIHRSQTHPLGQLGGVEKVTLTSGQMPVHTHSVNAVAVEADNESPKNMLWAKNKTSESTTDYKNYSNEAQTKVSMNASVISHEGGGQPHDNMMPSLAISFIISLSGIYPTQP